MTFLSQLCPSILSNLFESPWCGEKMVDHIGRHADEGGHPDAVANCRGPGRVAVVKQFHLWREGQEADNDELDGGQHKRQKKELESA